MKKIKLILFVMGLLVASSLQAQVSVNINLGSPPQWGPVGYSGVNYYYLPDVEAYYDVPNSRFIYLDGSRWIHRAYLPVRFRNYDLYSGYKVVMSDYRGNSPYIHFKEHKSKYARGYHGELQKTIGNKPGKGNPKHYAPARPRTYKQGKDYRVQNDGQGNSQKKNKGHGGKGKKN